LPIAFGGGFGYIRKNRKMLLLLKEEMMKLGDVLKKERERKGLTFEETAEKLGLSAEKYGLIEAGGSPAEEWGPRLAHIAIALETPTSRLLAESGRSEDCKRGQAGRLIKGHRERRGMSIEGTVLRIKGISGAGVVSISFEEYSAVEAGDSPIEEYGPLLLRFAEIIEQPVFNLFFPCGLPFQELDDYP
jgi:DNA-binding XRE family transcriptional regulator